jgi:hypothetical protein
MKKILILLLSVLSCSSYAFDADTLQIKNSDVQIKAVKLTESIVLDGKLDEAVWNIGGGFENFIQREPVEGVQPTEKTVVKIVYDDNALYIGARMFDSSPDSIIARLSRRDNLVTSDFFAVGLDPYHDKRSGYFFVINAAGVLIDGVLTENGFVSHFAELHGLNDLVPPNQIEIIPYATGKAEYTQAEDGNPFNDGSNYVPGAGLDIKMNVGTGLTLNGTINPDFGQVEIDPAVINLSDVEVFFPERRPFFIEGSSIFNFGRGGAQNYWGFNWGDPDFFYSRRIGRDPQGSVPDADYVDYPTGTHIIGAAKLTGKLGNSWNFGTIQSLTKREYARLHTEGIESRAEVEPLAYYGVIRAQKEFNEGSQGVGVLSTLALRDFKDQRLQDEFNKRSLSVGLDGWTFLDSSRTWVLAGWSGLSNVAGNSQQILDIQESSRHYFQRPDANHVSVDSNVTSLTGFSGRVVLNKEKGNFFVNSAFGFITPSFEVNDLGFLFRTDVINMHLGAGYDWTVPTDFYRSLALTLAAFQNYDFSGNLIGRGLFHFGNFQFLNYYNLNWSIGVNPEVMNNTRTRGGPITLNPPSFFGRFSLRSDDRKDWILRLYTSNFQNGFSNFWNYGFGIEFRPAPNISISFNPDFENNLDFSQYIGTYDD